MSHPSRVRHLQKQRLQCIVSPRKALSWRIEGEEVTRSFSSSSRRFRPGRVGGGMGEWRNKAGRVRGNEMGEV